MRDHVRFRNISKIQIPCRGGCGLLFAWLKINSVDIGGISWNDTSPDTNLSSSLRLRAQRSLSGSSVASLVAGAIRGLARGRQGMPTLFMIVFKEQCAREDGAVATRHQAGNRFWGICTARWEAQLLTEACQWTGDYNTIERRQCLPSH